MSKHTFDAYYRRACRQGHIGQKIKMLRNLNDWTQDYLAKQIGCTRITVNMWEQGKSIPGGRNLEKIAQVFGLSKEALLMIG
jgi:transcriptional regulator with XRE-family HTH domain